MLRTDTLSLEKEPPRRRQAAKQGTLLGCLPSVTQWTFSLAECFLKLHLVWRSVQQVSALRQS